IRRRVALSRPPSMSRRQMERSAIEAAGDGFQIPPPRVPVVAKLNLAPDWRPRDYEMPRSHARPPASGRPCASLRGGRASAVRWDRRRPEDAPVGWAATAPRTGPCPGAAAGVLVPDEATASVDKVRDAALRAGLNAGSRGGLRARRGRRRLPV